MKLVIGTATHNNLKYTKLFLESIECSYPYEILVVDNGSTDGTPQWLDECGLNYIGYAENRGFSYAYNDALDYAFCDEDNLLLFCGNDIVFRPECVDHLVQAMLESDFEMFCGSEVLNKAILGENEKALSNFKYLYSFDEKKYDNKLVYSSGGMNHSCLIRRKSVFDKVGYYDVNFYPAYFEDNDYARRCDLLGIKYGTVESAIFYHFWSRTIHEGGVSQLNSKRFSKNAAYYINKWGGVVGEETNKFPRCGIRISTRDDELDVLRGLNVIKHCDNYQ